MQRTIDQSDKDRIGVKCYKTDAFMESYKVKINKRSSLVKKLSIVEDREWKLNKKTIGIEVKLGNRFGR